MKRIQLLICALVAMFMLSATTAWAQYVKLTAEDGTESWIEIEGIINGESIEISSGSISTGNYYSAIDTNKKGSIDLNEVWSESGGYGTHYQVICIGETAFVYCSGLTSVKIPSSVTSIGDYAFSGCSGLTSVEIPSSVTSIGGSAFSYCSGLTSIKIPSGVTSIGSSAFSYCSGLTSIEIPSSVSNIGYGAFGGCSGLSSVVIPSGVTNIGQYAFSGCSDLTSIVVEPDNSIYDSRNNSNAIIETASNTLVAGCKNTTIPSSVTSIGDYAFHSCIGLTSVVIPSNVTSIGGCAFCGCIGLTSVVIPSSVSSIGYEAFYGCSSLNSIEIPYGVTSIGFYAFAYCSGLISVVIPSSVTSIDYLAFDGCIGLTSIVIPSSVTSIGSGVFQGCSGLTSIVVELGNTVYDSRENCNAIIETASNTLKFGCKNTKIPSSVTGIGYYAFSGCSGLTSIDIPSSVTSIEYGAFSGCSGLTSIASYITDVFETGVSAFSGCENATLYVPKGLVSTYRSTKDWNRINNLVESISLAMSCNNKGKVQVNGTIEFTNDLGEVNVKDGVDNTFTFQPNDNCELRQVLIDGLDVTLSVENNQLTTKVREGSKMIVMFDKTSSDVNGDGTVDISDVVRLVNIILGQ